MDKVTAQISQRTLLLILPLVFASFVTGTVAVFEQVGIMTMGDGDGYENLISLWQRIIFIFQPLQ